MTLKIAAVVCVLAFTASAATVQLFTNTTFDTGISGWTVSSTAGSGDSFFASTSTTTPFGWPTVGPSAGAGYAVSDTAALGVFPETTTLWQSVTIPATATGETLSVDMFVNDQFGSSGTGGEIAVWASGANTLTTAPLSVVFGPVDTTVAGGLPNGYVAYSTGLTLTPGTTYKIGVLESDAFGPINVGVDNFSLLATTGTPTVPEPGMLLPIGLMAAGALAYRARRKARA